MSSFCYNVTFVTAAEAAASAEQYGSDRTSSTKTIRHQLITVAVDRAEDCLRDGNA